MRPKPTGNDGRTQETLGLGDWQNEKYRRMGQWSRPLMRSGLWSQTTTGIRQPAARLKEDGPLQGLEPYKGRVFDPCCGSGGMFVQSEKFVAEHQGKANDISIYGQESNQTTWRLAKMNLAIRSIDASQVKWNNEGSFLNDAHKDLKADFIIANPPFNVSDWSGELLGGDGRWTYGAPPTGNANFAWLQHFVFHLGPSARAGVVLAKGALTSKTSGEGDIRKSMIADGNLIDCIVNLPAKLFLNTQIPAALWYLNRARKNKVTVHGFSLYAVETEEFERSGRGHES